MRFTVTKSVGKLVSFGIKFSKMIGQRSHTATLHGSEDSHIKRKLSNLARSLQHEVQETKVHVLTIVCRYEGNEAKAACNNL